MIVKWVTAVGVLFLVLVLLRRFFRGRPFGQHLIETG